MPSASCPRQKHTLDLGLKTSFTIWPEDLIWTRIDWHPKKGSRIIYSCFHFSLSVTLVRIAVFADMFPKRFKA